MTRRAQPRPQADIIFQDPTDQGNSCKSNAMAISRLLMGKMQEASGLSPKQIASLLDCSHSNVNSIMKSGTDGSSLAVLGSFAAACDYDIIISFKRKT